MTGQLHPDRSYVFGRHQRYIIAKMIKDDGWDPSWMPRATTSLGHAFAKLQQRCIITTKPVPPNGFMFCINEAVAQDLKEHCPWLTK